MFHLVDNKNTLSLIAKHSSLVVIPSNLLSSKFHLEAQDCSQNHLNILDKRIVLVIILIKAHLIRIDDIVIIPYRS